MKQKLAIIFESVLIQLQDIARELLPKGKKELYLLGFLLISYLSYSLFFGLETALVAHAERRMDLYFCFDNPVVFRRGYANAGGHPFLQMFSYLFILAGDILGKLVGMELRIIIFLLCTCLAVSMSVVYTFRYLSKIIELDLRISYTISLFYALFSTLIILAFTVESFTWSLWMLSFFVYYFSKKIKENEKSRLFTYLFSTLVLGGITVTNVVKGWIPLLFQNYKVRDKVKMTLTLGLTFLILIYFVDFYSLVFTRIQYFYDDFYDSANAGYCKLVLSYFWGAPILLSSLHMSSSAIGMWKGVYHPMISNSIYSEWWQYLFIVVILLFIVLALVKNYRNKLVKYLFLLLLFDVFLHTILQAGLYEAIIYGGHWVYTIPLFIGWLYKSLNAKQRKILFISLCSMIVFLAINNGFRMFEFANLALEYFPKTDSILNR